MDKDLYSILGVRRDATDKELKASYRRLARKYHPDVNPNDPTAEQKFKEIQAAYSVLSDPEKRRMYDTYGADFIKAGGRAPGSAGYTYRTMDWNEFVNTFGDISSTFGFSIEDILGDLLGTSRANRFSSRFGKRANPQLVPEKGEDHYQNATIDFIDAANGTLIKLNLAREVYCDRCGGTGGEPGTKGKSCPTCGGTGQVAQGSAPFMIASTCDRCGGRGTIPSKSCSLCGGSGLMKKDEKVEVKIPAGVNDGSLVRVAGKGRPGRNGGEYGDFYLRISLRPHPYMRREGDNVYLTVPVTVSEAILGDEIDIPTLNGRVRLRLPAATPSGKEFRLKGKGFPHLNGSGRGDMFVRIEIVPPENLSVHGRELVRELANTHPYNPRLKVFGF